MMKKTAVAIVHGIGRQDKTYADEFVMAIDRAYKKLTGKSNLVFKSICWQEEIEPIEQELYEKLKLKWMILRSFFIGYVGDALCYQPLSSSEAGFYDIVHKAIDRGISRLAEHVDVDSPLCIISHSLGTVVSSNFLWDIQKSNKPNLTSPATANLTKNLKLLYTMASPLAVWSMRYPEGGTPITLDASVKWFNLYSTNDIISSPIKIINQQYSSMSNLSDEHIKVGGLFTSWNPLSHNAYWNDRRVIDHIVSNLAKLA